MKKRKDIAPFGLLLTLIVLGILFLCVQSAGAQTISDYCTFTEQWEGRRTTAYKDADGYSIGVGHHTNARPLGPLSETQINTLLRQDIVAARDNAREIVKAFDQHPPEVKKIIVDMIFNLGPRGFKSFNKTIDAINKKQYDRASIEMRDSTWYQQTGRRARNHVATMRNIDARDSD